MTSQRRKATRQFTFVLLVVIFGAVLCRAKTPSEDWLPISPQELQYKEVPGEPGAPAVMLYYADYITYVSDYDQTEFIYRRIKILTESGKSYADVEIPVYPWSKIQNLEARSISPDGTVSPITTAPYEKAILKGRGFKFLAKAFTIPNAGVGTIVEYKYKLHSNAPFSKQWPLQHNLYTVKEHFLFKHTLAMGFVVNGSDAKPSNDKEAYELEMANVQPFLPEEQMPPEENYKASVRFFGGYQSNFWSRGAFWSQQAWQWSRFITTFLAENKQVTRAAAEAIGNASVSEDKLRRLYARAQAIRNLSYERERTEIEEKRERIKENNNVADVLKHGYGTAFDINALFVALVRAAGLDASFIMAADRSGRFFQQDYLSEDQYNASITDVTLKGKTVFLDPGTKFCPFGLIRWTHSATAGLEFQKGTWHYFNIPGTREENAVVLREMRGTVTEDGTLQGTISLTLEGEEALEHRLLALQTDEAGRNKMMEQEVLHWLPAQSSVTITGSRGWNSQEDPLVASFEVEIPSYATVIGKRILLPANLFPTNQKETFRHSQRKYPVYFLYPFSEFDLTVIKLPEAYSAENLPQPVQAKTYFGQYGTSTKIAENQLISTRTLVLSLFLFEPQRYEQLKEFFATAIAGDESQIVLRGPAAGDDKPAQH